MKNRSHKEIPDVYFTTFNKLFSYQHFEIAFDKCIKGIRWKKHIQKIIQNKEIFIWNLYQSIHTNTYTIHPVNNFTIAERGKIRKIEAYHFADKIIQRIMCNWFLVPLLTKKLIYDCGATVKQKGMVWVKNRCVFHLNKFWLNNHTNNGFCLTIDISKYFESINHNILIKKVSKYILDTRIKNLFEHLVKFNKKGLGLGSQISQICALFYLNELDHKIKEKLNIKYYGRYMDDLYLIHSNKKYLYKCFSFIGKELKKLKLKINQDKSKVQLLSNGFIFLKTKFRLTSKGEVIKKITNNSFQSMKRKLKKGVNPKEIFNSWYSYASWFTDWKRTQTFLKQHKLLFFAKDLKIRQKNKK